MGIQVLWTSKINETLTKDSKTDKQSIESAKKFIREMQEELTKMCLDKITSTIDKVKIETLVTIQVH